MMQNISGESSLVRYFESGSKPEGSKALGVEIEHFLVRKRDFSPVFYQDAFGQRYILERLYDRLSRKGRVHEVLEKGNLIGVECDDYAISLEPAGQIEISVRPSEDIFEILDICESFENDMRVLLSPADMALIACGYAPKACAASMPLIPKKRYERMLSHFRRIGPYGEMMMKATASLQVSVDYFSQNDFGLKYRVGMKVMPILKLLASNSPFFEAKPNSDPLLRTWIWNGTDPKRCAYPDAAFSQSFSFSDYADFVLSQKMIFYPFSDWLENGMSVRDFFSERRMEERDVEFVLSMVFPEIRLKRVIELRGMDSVSIAAAGPLLALIKGFFYSDGALNTLDGADVLGLMPLSDRGGFERISRDVSENGFDAIIAGRSVRQIALKVIGIAMERLTHEERRIIEKSLMIRSLL